MNSMSFHKISATSFSFNFGLLVNSDGSFLINDDDGKEIWKVSYKK